MSGWPASIRPARPRFLLEASLAAGLSALSVAATLLTGPLAILAPPAAALVGWGLTQPFRALTLLAAVLPAVPFDTTGPVYAILETCWFVALSTLCVAVLVRGATNVASLLRAYPALLLFLGVLASRVISLWFGPDLPMDQAKRDWVTKFFWYSTLDSSLLIFGAAALENAQQLKRWLWVAVGTGVPHAIAVYFTGYWPEWKLDLDPRHAGYFAGSQDAAAYLLFYLSAAIALFALERRLSRRLFLLIAAAIFLGGQYYTKAKTVLVALAVSYVLVVFVRQNVQTMIRYLVLSLLVLIAILPLIPQNVMTLFRVIVYSILDPNTKVFEEQRIGPVAGRIIVARFGLSLFLDHPITGVGWGKHDILLQPMFSWNLPFNIIHTHYITVLAETGLVGFVAFAAVIVFTLVNLRSALRAFRAAGQEEAVSLCRASLVTYGAVLIIYISLYDVVGRVFWLFGGFS